jgi:hypothetical protein
MSANIRIAAAAATVLITPALGFAQGLHNPVPRVENQQQWTGNAMSGAYAAAKKSRRATQPAPRASIARVGDPSMHIIAPDGRDVGTDPDATIRFQLRRDSSMGGM